ncbi:streptophobe family protein [Streptomyces sp. MA25(2023)]|uniref:streptophobe family protein n=1 Tax=Streptomyces sp. MA25(2023) TaxID=3055078 RepID=UPI0025B137E4|nr:streptophobe family protein [Streptomyces sp. MA25(2023)]MDN3256554.1 streptophobe family protein [Streptomyces sp. MA25(2023)]
MSASTSVGTDGYGTRVPWGDVLMSAIASVSWALIGMAGTAALGLHLLGADAAGSLGPMTAAVVALGAGGSVSPAGDVSAFGLEGAQAHTAIEITPLGVGLVGALFLSFFFLRSLRAAGVVVPPAELLVRAGAVVALFVAMLGGLAWVGHDVITIDGGSLGLDDLPGSDGGGGGIEIPGLGDVGGIGDIGGLLPDRIDDLVDAEAAVGFTVDTGPTLLGGLVWSVGVLLIALLSSRRTPLPRGCEAVHRVVRPAVSAVVTVALAAVAAGWAAAGWAAIGDDHPRRIVGAALLGAPNGVWLGVPLGLFVPWEGRATGELVRVLPDPLDRLLGSGARETVTLGRLAELDGRVWVLGAAAALTMLLAGVLTAARTPVAPGEARSPAFAVRCAVRLGVVTALTLPLLARLTEVSVDASLSVLGIDAFGAGIDLRGRIGTALLLGAVWGAGAGAAGALLTRVSGAAGARATVVARSAGMGGRTGVVGSGGAVGRAGVVGGGAVGGGAVGAGAGDDGGGGGGSGAREGWSGGAGAGGAGGTAYSGAPPGPPPGPYRPDPPHRPADPGANPYLRPRGGGGEPEDARPEWARRSPVRAARRGAAVPAPASISPAAPSGRAARETGGPAATCGPAAASTDPTTRTCPAPPRSPGRRHRRRGRHGGLHVPGSGRAAGHRPAGARARPLPRHRLRHHRAVRGVTADERRTPRERGRAGPPHAAPAVTGRRCRQPC